MTQSTQARISRHSNFDKQPEVAIPGHNGISGWTNIAEALKQHVNRLDKPRKLLVIETYHGARPQELINQLSELMPAMKLFSAQKAFLNPAQLEDKLEPFVTDDPVFGYITPLEMTDFFDPGKLDNLKTEIAASDAELICIYGPGASLVADADLLVYADMPRWEIQLRFRRNEIANLGAVNNDDPFSYQYKRAFFVDWRVCDRLKKSCLPRADYVLDVTNLEEPKMIGRELLAFSLAETVKQPFRVVPFFDPGPWGGQWLKEVFDLDKSAVNYAWGFDCVPEENSLLLRFDNLLFETPSINLVFFEPDALLGKPVREVFGEEFPIRFDFLDTMEGGNLSLQVHPLKQYIRDHFGMDYTQDESYYFIDAAPDASVYLGLKENIDPEKMLQALEMAQQDGSAFDAEKYVAKWPVEKHDHVLIPAGTVHCSGANSVVLEISATPYIFTFKLWDWGRNGLDGKPRPISIRHGRENIQWDRTLEWTKNNLLNQVEQMASGDGWTEERTGLHESFFIETRRHWFTGTVPHDTQGVVNVLNLIEGEEAIVESPSGAFEPFVIHYAETFIVPAAVGAYSIRPHGPSQGKRCGTLKAFVHTENLEEYHDN